MAPMASATGNSASEDFERVMTAKPMAAAQSAMSVQRLRSHAAKKKTMAVIAETAPAMFLWK